MRNFRLIAVAGLLAAGAVLPAAANPDACLAVNRIETTRPTNDHTVVATDKDKRAYTIHMRGSCPGLNKFSEKLAFRTQTQLGCIGTGDTVSYSLPGDNSFPRIHGPQTQDTCFVDNVTAGAPSQN